MLPSGARSHSYDHGVYEGAASSISSLSLSSVRERSTRRRSGGGLLNGALTRALIPRRRSSANTICDQSYPLGEVVKNLSLTSRRCANLPKNLGLGSDPVRS